VCIFYDVSIPNITIILVIADALHSVCIGILIIASGSGSNFFRKKISRYIILLLQCPSLFPTTFGVPIKSCVLLLNWETGTWKLLFSLFYLLEPYSSVLKISLYYQVTFNGSFDHMSIDSTR